MNAASLKKSLKTLSFFSMIMYVLDIILLGTGVATKYGPFSSRILFFAVAVLAAIPDMWENRKALLKNKFIWLIGAFLLYISLMGVYGYFVGNNVSVIAQDLKGYVNFAILPVMLVNLNSKEKINQFLKFIFVACLAVALLSFALTFTKFLPTEISNYLLDRFKHYGIAQLSYLTNTATRVFFDTATRYMFTAFVIGLYFTASKTKPNILAIIATGGVMASVYVSYTRGIYLGAVIAGVVAIVLVFVCARAYIKNAFKSFALITVVCVILISGLSIVQKENLFNVGFLRTISSLQIDTTDWEISEEINAPQEERSMSVREYRLTEINKAIKNSPIFGNGLGYTIDEETEYIEYFYHDLWAKTGIVGVVLFMAPLFALLSDLLKKRRKIAEHTLMLQSLMYSSAIFVYAISYFNPCMNSTVGISIFTLSIAVIMPVNGWDCKLVSSGKSE